MVVCSPKIMFDASTFGRLVCGTSRWTGGRHFGISTVADFARSMVVKASKRGSSTMEMEGRSDFADGMAMMSRETYRRG